MKWLSTDAAVNSFVLEYKRKYANSDWQEAVVNGATNYLIENLEPDTDYDVRVFSVNGEGMRSPPSTTVWAKTEKGG